MLGVALVVSKGAAGEDQTKSGSSDADKKKKEEKPKEPEFKFSAWCAFRDFARVQQPPPEPNADPMKRDQARPGAGQWSGFARHGKWINLVVELQNTTEKDPYSGAIRVRLDPTQESTETGEKPYTTRYRQDYELPPQTTKRFSFSVLAPEYSFNQIEVNISANGQPKSRTLSLVDLDQNVKKPDELVVAVSDEAGAFKFLTSRSKSNPDGMDDEGINRQVAVVRPVDLPDRWYDLMMANLIVIDNPPREGFSDDQIEALEAYCQAGGHLLIGAGKDPSRLGPREGQYRSLADLAGVRVNGSAAISQIDLYPPAFKGTGEDWKLPIVDVSVKPDLQHVYVVKNQGKEGYIEEVERVVGLGSVTFLTFSLSDEQLQAWAGRQQLPLYLLENAVRPPLFGLEDPRLENKMGTNQWGWPAEEAASGPDRGTLFKLRKDVDESYTKDTPVETQKKPFVASFLLLFLLFAVPGNYMIFGWFKRREIAWLAVPLWAMGFSVAAYFIGYYGRVGKLTINQLCVVEAGPGQQYGAGRTFMGIYSPRRGEYKLEFRNEHQWASRVQAGPGHLIRDLRTRGITDVLPEIDIVAEGGGMSVDNLLVQARATRRLEINHRVDLGDGIKTRMKGKSNSGASVYEISVQNQTPSQIIGAALVHRGPQGLRAIELGNLDPSMAEAKVIEAPVTEGAPWKDVSEAFFKDPPKFRYARGSDATDRGRAVLEFLRARIELYGESVLVGWIDGGILPVKVDGEDPGSSRGMTLLIVPFPEERARGSERVARGRRIQVSPDFDVIPANNNWKALKPDGGLSRLSVRGQDEGTLVFRTTLPQDELKTLSNKMLSVELKLRALGEKELGQQRGGFNGFQGHLVVEVQERVGNQTRWTQIPSVQAKNIPIPFNLTPGMATKPIVFECPFTPAQATNRNVTIKVTTRNLKTTGNEDDNATEWTLAVEAFKLDIVDKSKPKEKQ